MCAAEWDRVAAALCDAGRVRVRVLLAAGEDEDAALRLGVPVAATLAECDCVSVPLSVPLSVLLLEPLRKANSAIS